MTGFSALSRGGPLRVPAVAQLLLVAALLLAGMPVTADSTEARCDVYSRGEDHTKNSGPCTFSQSQGYITITREDGVRHELTPDGETAGNFRDQGGQRVYRNSGLGRAGLIFRFPQESVFVYWGNFTDKASDPDNPTAPYSTADFDATILLPCRADSQSDMASCPAGIMRMEDGQASITLMSTGGEQFTINFMNDYVNATGREVAAEFKDDWWYLTVDGVEEYKVPLAAIEGG